MNEEEILYPMVWVAIILCWFVCLKTRVACSKLSFFQIKRSFTKGFTVLSLINQILLL